MKNKFKDLLSIFIKIDLHLWLNDHIEIISTSFNGGTKYSNDKITYLCINNADLIKKRLRERDRLGDIDALSKLKEALLQ